MTAPSGDPLSHLSELEGLPSGYAAARDAIDTVLRDRGLRRTAPESTAESLLRGAHASAVLEGSSATLEQVRGGGGDDVAADAVRVSAQALGLAPLLGRAPLQAFARLHSLAGSGTVADDRLGRPRDGDAAARLRGLAQLLLAPTEAPALLVAALVHAELATATPFASHNGIVARAAERLVLVARGVDPTSLVVPEAAHLALRPAYESNLRGYASGAPEGAHAWLVYTTEAYVSAAEASPLVTG